MRKVCRSGSEEFQSTPEKLQCFAWASSHLTTAIHVESGAIATVRKISQTVIQSKGLDVTSQTRQVANLNVNTDLTETPTVLIKPYVANLRETCHNNAQSAHDLACRIVNRGSA